MKNYQKKRLWNCLSNALYTIQVNLTDGFKQKLLDNLPSNKSRIIRLLNNTSYAKKGNIKASQARWFSWFKYNDVNIPLWAAMGLCKLAKIPLEEMERNITFYKQKTLNYICIKNPKLPITINPTFVSLASHFCFDGSLPKDGKGTYYSQKNKEQIDNFVQKIQECFGDTYISITKDGKDIPKIRLPRLIGEICKYVCNFDNFETFNSAIPSNLMNLSKEFRLAILISAIVDEGHLQDQYIQFQFSNKELTEDIRDICVSLDYECSKINKRERGKYANSYYFYMKSIERFYHDYLNLNKKFPLISLTFKSDKIKFFIDSIKYPKGKSTVKSANLRKNKILQILDKPKTSYEIAERTLINPRSVRRLLLKLIKEGKIRRIKKNHFYYYSLYFPF